MSDSAVTLADLAAVWTGALATVNRVLAVRTHVLFPIVQHEHPLLKKVLVIEISLYGTSYQIISIFS